MPDLSFAGQSKSADRLFLLMAVLAIGCAGLLTVASPESRHPVLGGLTLLPVTMVCAVLGWFLLRPIYWRGLGLIRVEGVGMRHFAGLLMLGAVLAVPAIAIDLVWRFPQDMNLAMPEALAFYPAIALVAEVLFHLFPLSLFCLLAPKATPVWLLLMPVVFVEPVFQMLVNTGPRLQSWLVFASVSLVSASQLWVFWRFGFVAMMGLRISFYLFWHVLWGAMRLSLLF